MIKKVILGATTVSMLFIAADVGAKSTDPAHEDSQVFAIVASSAANTALGVVQVQNTTTGDMIEVVEPENALEKMSKLR